MTPSASTSESTARNGEPICSCGATERSAKSPDRCVNGHVLRGNRAAAITGQHGADFRREHQAEIDAKADQFARDAGYSSLRSAPLGFQIAAIALARTATIGDLAYWKMLEAGGPLSESGKPRRAYSIWADTNRDLARDLKGAMTEVVAARPPGSGNSLVTEYRDRTTDDLIALADSLGAELRALQAQDAESEAARRRFAVPMGGAQPVPPSCTTRNISGPALSRNSAPSPTAPQAAGLTIPEPPGLIPSPDSAAATAESSRSEPGPSAISGRPSGSAVTVNDDPYARFRNL